MVAKEGWLGTELRDKTVVPLEDQDSKVAWVSSSLGLKNRQICHRPNTFGHYFTKYTTITKKLAD